MPVDEATLNIWLCKTIWAGSLIALGVVIRRSQHPIIRHFREETLPNLVSILKNFCRQITKPLFGLKP